MTKQPLLASCQKKIFFYWENFRAVPKFCKRFKKLSNFLFQTKSYRMTSMLAVLELCSTAWNYYQSVPKAPLTLESVLSEFMLDNSTLKQMMNEMNRQMELGLEFGSEKSSIAMLPSFVPHLPDGSEIGKYLAMDLGGTNLRVLLLDLRPEDEDTEIHPENRNFRIPNAVMIGTGEQLFDFIVSCLANFLEEKKLSDSGLSLGFTFSYPCDQTSLESAKLLHWTKGFNASGVEGNDVVALLRKAIDRHGKINVRVKALMNDTVGTQVATAHEFGKCDLGVIVATGTNASYMEKAANVKKLQGANYSFPNMVIDTEWGGFGDRNEAEYIKTEYDRIVDSRSVHPGVQSFDKLVAGMYMGELVRLVLEKLINAKILFKTVSQHTMLMTQDSFPTKYISEILNDQGGHLYQTRQILDELGIDGYSYADLLVLRETCMCVSRRSANLTAAAIACVLLRINKRKVTVGIDGSTYRFHPFYHTWVQDKLRELLPAGIDFRLVQAGDGSGKGAAMVAAIADLLEQENNATNN